MPMLLGEWWEGKDGCHGVMEKLGRSPTGLHPHRDTAHHGRNPETVAGGEKGDTHEQKPERAWFSPEEDENSDSPLHRQTYTRNLKRRYMSI